MPPEVWIQIGQGLHTGLFAVHNIEADDESGAEDYALGLLRYLFGEDADFHSYGAHEQE